MHDQDARTTLQQAEVPADLRNAGPTAGGGRVGGRVRIPVPRSNVVVEPARTEPAGGHRAVVRCRACDRRAFDVVGVPADVLVDDATGLGTLLVERACRCGRQQGGPVTGRPGVAPAGGLAGRWCCECGSFLAEVDAVRGRVAVRCRRCPLELRATAADAMAAAVGAVVPAS